MEEGRRTHFLNRAGGHTCAQTSTLKSARFLVRQCYLDKAVWNDSEKV